MTGALAVSFGGHVGLVPLLVELQVLVGEPVRVCVRRWREPGQDWIRGVLRSVDVREAADRPPCAVVELCVVDRTMRMVLPRAGTAIWRCPRRATLSVLDENGQIIELARRDPGTGILDDLEHKLGAALVEEDPRVRHLSLAGLQAEAEMLLVFEEEESTRLRLRALHEFLAPYR